MSNDDIESQLNELPETVAAALLNWRRSTLNREKLEAMLYLEFKANNDGATATEIKARIHASDKRYEYVLIEAQAESNYTRLLERLLAAKKMASLRTAY